MRIARQTVWRDECDQKVESGFKMQSTTSGRVLYETQKSSDKNSDVD